MRSNSVLPFYVVCDVSYSMMDHLDALNDGLRDLHSAIGSDLAVTKPIQFCLIGFAESPEILIPLATPEKITELSGLTVRAVSNYGAIFTFLRDQIDRDIDMLVARSYQVCRPAVFFLSDGQPTDPSTWPASFASLTDVDWIARPYMIAFGIGDADPVTINRIGTFRAFHGRDGVSLAVAARSVTQLLITSATTLSVDRQ